MAIKQIELGLNGDIGSNLQPYEPNTKGHRNFEFSIIMGFVLFLLFFILFAY